MSDFLIIGQLPTGTSWKIVYNLWAMTYHIYVEDQLVYVATDMEMEEFRQTGRFRARQTPPTPKEIPHE